MSEIPRARQPRLLPKSERVALPVSAALSASSTYRNSLPKKKSAVVACEPCRKRKSKCSGERPTCNRCVKNGTACQYDSNAAETHSQALKRKFNQLQAKDNVYQELFMLMQSMPERDALDILRRVRQGDGVDAILNHVKNGSLLLQLAIEPETRYRYEFPYRSMMPTDLVESDNPYLKSVIYEAASIFPSFSLHDLPSARANNPKAPWSSYNAVSDGRLGGAEYQSPCFKPLHAAQIVDSRLDFVQPSSWTSVSTDDNLMRQLLGAYFLYEYPIYPSFQKDYFLEDMAAQQTGLCSSLLVNVVLAYACYCFRGFLSRAEYWNPQNLGYRFLAEARRIWELRAGDLQITTLQAAVLLNVIYNFCGLDKIGVVYGAQAVTMAYDLRLFGGAVNSNDQRQQHARDFTAWAVFNFETLCAYHFLRSPLITHPPDVALPDPSADPKWYSEVRVRYPLDNIPLSTSFGQLFKANSRLRIIMNEFCQESFTEDSTHSPSQADEFYTRLRNWLEELPSPLQPASIALPGQFHIHMECQNLLISLYEPFETNTPNQKNLRDARIHLQTIIRLWYLRHGFTVPNVYLCQPLALIAFRCLKELQEDAADVEGIRSTLFLMAKGLRDQAHNFYVSETIFRVVQGQMRTEELNLMKSLIDIADLPDDKSLAAVQRVQADWTATIVSKANDVDAHRLGQLVQQHLNVSSRDRSALSHNS